MSTTTPLYNEHYRQSNIGLTLADTLDNLVTNHRITPQLAKRIITHFDRIVAQTLSEEVHQCAVFKGNLDVYNLAQEVFIATASDVKFKLVRAGEYQEHATRISASKWQAGEVISIERVKMVAMKALPEKRGQGELRASK